MLHWQWVSGPAAAFMTAAIVVQQSQAGVSDELERVISILVPLVAALLSPMVAAIVLLFRQLLGEMRANRVTTSDVTRVVSVNTAAFDAHAKGTDRLIVVIETLSERLGRLESRMERMEQTREH